MLAVEKPGAQENSERDEEVWRHPFQLQYTRWKIFMAENLNSEEIEEFQLMFGGEMNIENLFVSGQFTEVWLSVTNIILQPNIGIL